MIDPAKSPELRIAYYLNAIKKFEALLDFSGYPPMDPQFRKNRETPLRTYYRMVGKSHGVEQCEAVRDYWTSHFEPVIVPPEPINNFILYVDGPPSQKQKKFVHWSNLIPADRNEETHREPTTGPWDLPRHSTKRAELPYLRRELLGNDERPTNGALYYEHNNTRYSLSPTTPTYNTTSNLRNWDPNSWLLAELAEYHIQLSYSPGRHSGRLSRDRT